MTIEASGSRLPFRISCPSGELINIKDAAYGRSDGTTCPSAPHAMSNHNCLAPNSLEKVQEKYVRDMIPFVIE